VTCCVDKHRSGASFGSWECLSCEKRCAVRAVACGQAFLQAPQLAMSTAHDFDGDDAGPSGDGPAHVNELAESAMKALPRVFVRLALYPPMQAVWALAMALSYGVDAGVFAIGDRAHMALGLLSVPVIGVAGFFTIRDYVLVPMFLLPAVRVPHCFDHICPLERCRPSTRPHVHVYDSAAPVHVRLCSTCVGITTRLFVFCWPCAIMGARLHCQPWATMPRSTWRRATNRFCPHAALTITTLYCAWHHASARCMRIFMRARAHSPLTHALSLVQSLKYALTH